MAVDMDTTKGVRAHKVGNSIGRREMFAAFASLPLLTIPATPEALRPAVDAKLQSKIDDLKKIRPAVDIASSAAGSFPVGGDPAEDDRLQKALSEVLDREGQIVASIIEWPAASMAELSAKARALGEHPIFTDCFAEEYQGVACTALFADIARIAGRVA